MTVPIATAYESPTGDEPLDALERAFVRAMVSALLAEIHDEGRAGNGDTKSISLPGRGPA